MGRVFWKVVLKIHSTSASDFRTSLALALVFKNRDIIDLKVSPPHHGGGGLSEDITDFTSTAVFQLILLLLFAPWYRLGF